MSAPALKDRTYLDQLARAVLGKYPEAMTCRQLRDAFRFQAELRARGVGSGKLILASRVYARRVDALGPEEFDRRCDLGL